MVLFRHGCLIVKDLDKAIKFYTENFGLKIINVDTLSVSHASKLFGVSGTHIRYAKFNDDAYGVLELIETDKHIPPHISFTVEDIDGMYEKLKDKVMFLSPPFKAPDGPARVCWCLDEERENVIELVEPLKNKKEK